LFDAKAGYSLDDMAEKAMVQLVDRLRNSTEQRDIRGLCHITGEHESKQRLDYLELPSY
jgi:hypothetical protein